MSVIKPCFKTTVMVPTKCDCDVTEDIFQDIILVTWLERYRYKVNEKRWTHPSLMDLELDRIEYRITAEVSVFYRTGSLCQCGLHEDPQTKCLYGRQRIGR